MIEASGEEILVDHLLPGKTVFGDVRIVGDGAVRQMIKSQEFLGVWIYGYGDRISVRVVNQTVPVQAVVVLLGSSAGNSQLLTETAVAAVCTRGKAWLSLNCVDTWLQSGEIGPTTTVQGKLTNRSGLHCGTEVGTGELYRRR